ncbi:hypothetical protein ACIO8H_20625 [Streptomyces sp. NPDC087226]|uniref:hypothetical protein n=1 Tax=Streptomyces sp. NPDC087226 TaxID=3365771 RepID=UPI0038274ED2
MSEDVEMPEDAGTRGGEAGTGPTIGELLGLAGWDTSARSFSGLDVVGKQIQAALWEATDGPGMVARQTAHWFKTDGVLGPSFERLRQAAAAGLPRNWSGLASRWNEMLHIMQQDGIPLAWVPPHEILEELLDASGSTARRIVLDENRSAIWDSCRVVLEEVERTEFEHQKRYLMECLAMVEDGYVSGAQSLAATVWDTTVRGFVRATPSLQTDRGQFRYEVMLSGLPTLEEDPTVRHVRVLSFFAPFKMACTNFHGGTPVPGHFNRHATAHAAGQIQFTSVNATIAIMLAVSVLRGFEQDRFPVRIHA